WHMSVSNCIDQWYSAYLELPRRPPGPLQASRDGAPGRLLRSAGRGAYLSDTLTTRMPSRCAMRMARRAAAAMLEATPYEMLPSENRMSYVIIVVVSSRYSPRRGVGRYRPCAVIRASPAEPREPATLDATPNSRQPRARRA